MEESVEILEEVKDDSEATQDNEESSVEFTCIKQLLIDIWKLILKLNVGPVRFLSKLLQSKPVAVIRTQVAFVNLLRSSWVSNRETT